MRNLRILVAGLIALAGFASPVNANHQATPFHSTTRSTTYTCCWTRYETADSFSMRANMSWVSLPAQNQRANQVNHIFFTMDQNDISHNVEAYAFGGTIPDPYFDTDDDNGDYRSDEGEIVSERTTFPSAGVTYSATIYWSHWYTGFSYFWAYDPDGGSVEFDENLSTMVCPFPCDKYDTHGGTNVNWFLNKTYPANPQGLVSVPNDAVSTPPSAIGNGSAAGRSYEVTPGNSPSEVTLHADMSRGLASYARSAQLLAERTITGGSAEGVVTFSHPLSWDEFASVERAGLDVRQIELVSAPDKDGLRWTIFVPNEPGRIQMAEGIAADAGVEVLGIVSANAAVPNQDTLERVQGSNAVYLVDLSITDYRRLNPGVRDVGQNDVYWLLAGWN